MAFKQEFERENSGYYSGQQVGATPANGDTYNVAYQSIFRDIPPNRQSVIAISQNPLTFPAPANVQTLASVEINGKVYEGSQIEYDPVDETIKVYVDQEV